MQSAILLYKSIKNYNKIVMVILFNIAPHNIKDILGVYIYIKSNSSLHNIYMYTYVTNNYNKLYFITLLFIFTIIKCEIINNFYSL